MHVLHLLGLVIRPLEVEAKHRNAPSVHHLWIDLAERVLVRDHLAAPRQPHCRAVAPAYELLERRSIALVLTACAVERANQRHPIPAADLDVVSARKADVL